jgi:hypothetical protein
MLSCDCTSTQTCFSMVATILNLQTSPSFDISHPQTSPFFDISHPQTSPSFDISYLSHLQTTPFFDNNSFLRQQLLSSTTTPFFDNNSFLRQQLLSSTHNMATPTRPHRTIRGSPEVVVKKSLTAYAHFDSIPIPLSVLCFDFVDGFPISKEGHNKVLTITCKTTKYVRFLVGKETWTAEDWAEEYSKNIYCD